ncbi:patatin-like phospholipase family protein [bacterium]|nr:patatin-like phospholipase family protein [bacterium]
MKAQADISWFSLARQPQEPLAKGGKTLVGDDLRRWREQFRPFLNYVRRKEVVLVLSGGGMNLPCHIGALKVFELLGIPVDHIYGTSAGAVVGGMYAAGMSTTELERMVLDIQSPDELFGFAARYPRLRLVTNEIRRKLLRIPPEESGIYSRTQVEQYVSGVLMKYVGRVPTLGELGMGFSSVTLDVGTGKEDDCVSKRVFSSHSSPDVNLSDAIGASMAIPGVFPPKRIDGRYHLDGGVVEQLAIDTAYDDWRRKRSLLRRRGLVIVAVDLAELGRAPSRSKLSQPVDLVIYAQTFRGRTITRHSLFRCHHPRRGCSVILVRPSAFGIDLHEIEKIPRAIFEAYERTVEQLSGSGFLDGTLEGLRQARLELGIRHP